MNNRKPHPQVPENQYHPAPAKLIEVYEDELARVVTDYLLQPELQPGEKATFYRAGVHVHSATSPTPGKKEKYFHFRVYRP